MAERVEQHGFGLQRGDMGGAERQDFSDAKPAGRARQQHNGMGEERVGQGIERARRIATSDRAGPGQARDADTVPVEAEAARRAGITQHGGIIRNIGVYPLGEVIQEQKRAARGLHPGQDLRAGRVAGRVDRLVLAHRCLRAERQQNFGARQHQQGGNARLHPVAFDEACREGQSGEQSGDQLEGRADIHQPEHQQAARPGAHQIRRVDMSDSVRLGDETERDEQPGSEEKGQECEIIEPDIFELRQIGDLVLKLQRVKRIENGGAIAECRTRDEKRRQYGK